MLKRIIKNEWRNLFAEKSFIILGIVFAALLIYGIFNGASWIKMRQAQSQALFDEEEKDFIESYEKLKNNFQPPPDKPWMDKGDSPYSFGMSLIHASLPFNSMALVSLGQSDILNLDAGITISTLQRTKAEKVGLENPLSFLTNRFDLSFVIVYLLPLFIFALSFNLLSAERENGTLSILLSQPIKLKQILISKVLGHFILIFGLVVGVSLVGIFFSGISISSDGLIRLLLWILVVAVYSAFWFAVAVFVNSFGFSSATNAVISSAVWLFLVLILPSLLNVAISAAYPMPSRTEIVSAERGVSLDMRAEGSKLLSEHYQDHPELMPKNEKPDLNDFGLAFVYIQQRKKEKVQEVEARFDEALARQQSLVNKLRFLSPSIITQEALNDIGGTGLIRYQHFRQQVKDFDKAWSDFFTPKIYRLEKLTLADYDKMPKFSFQEESLGSVMSRVGFGILFLFIASAVLLFLAFGKLANYRLEK